MLLENLVLERFHAVPKGRRQEWVRGLLVAGYLSEARAAREESLSEKQGRDMEGENGMAPVAQNAFSLWLGRTNPARPHLTGDQLAPVTEDKAVDVEPLKAVGSTTDKPFSHLRKVIG